MFWRSKPNKATPVSKQQVDDAIDNEADDEAEQDAEISAALQIYQEEFSERLKAGPNLAAERAREVVARAVKVVRESGLGDALAPTLLEHVIHWPSWSKRDDFDQWKGFPAENVRGGFDGEISEKCVVHFTYNGTPYTLRFSEDDRSWGSGSDCTIHGRVHLITNSRSVLGLNAWKDLAKDAAGWKWFNVFAFVPGPWMKDLIEIAAYIEHSEDARWRQHSDENAIDQAANIALSVDD